MANFFGGGGNDVFIGTNGADLFTSGGGGNDNFMGKAGADAFNFLADLDPLDQVNGGAGNDILNVNGPYVGGNALVFAATTMTNVETLMCAGGFGYDFTLNDGNTAAGTQLIVDDTAGAGPNGLSLNGSAETDGFLALLGGGATDLLIGGQLGDKIYGGGAADELLGQDGIDTIKGGGGGDFITGGLGGDRINAGGGSDNIFENPVLDSTSVNYDIVKGFDFAGVDLFQLPVVVAGTNALIGAGTLSTATFDPDLVVAVNPGTLAAGNAVIFTPNLGTLAGLTFLIVDANGAPGYQPSADYVIELVAPLNPGAFNAADFA
jgi:Ca2+-binding RTX toxin-like protein